MRQQQGARTDARSRQSRLRAGVATADDDEQLTSATEFARKRAASLARYDAATRKRRLYGQLARRGFTPDVIRSAMEAVDAE